MSNLPSRYALSDVITDEVALALAKYDTRLQQLLFSRGLCDQLSAEEFITPDYDNHQHDPFLFAGMRDAVERITKAMKEDEKVTIFSDYDCDGIPGAVVLHDFFKEVGFANFVNYIPHRHYEGFGLSVEAVEKIAELGTKLIITIDCGSTNNEAVARANELGLSVIITDHHELPILLPEAVAIINPKLAPYPFPDLCGAGVVYKLVQALLKSGSYQIKPGHEKWWLDMVGLATIADMVPLTGENRVFAYFGLKVLRKSRRPGLQKLLRKAKLDQRNICEDDIGFTIGPRINAASRMDAPEKAFNLLSINEEAEASVIVDNLEALNTERRSLVAVMTRELHEFLKNQTNIPPVIVYGNPNWRPALAGLVANKVAEEYSRPAFVWGRDGNGVIKGSCRSGGSGQSVVQLMEGVATSFLEYGGHHASGGFAVTEDAIFTLNHDLNQVYEQMKDILSANAETIHIDLVSNLSEIPQLLNLQNQLAPFGAGNPKPVFIFNNILPKKVEWFGKGKEHLKVVLEENFVTYEAIAFFAKETSYHKQPVVGETLNLIANIENSFFMGRQQVRLRIIDLV